MQDASKLIVKGSIYGTMGNYWHTSTVFWYVMALPKCIDQLQSLDVIINKPAKYFLRAKIS